MSSVVVSGDTSGSITISAPAISGTNTLTLPAVTDTLVGLAATQTLTNKTLTAPALGTPASGNLANCTGITDKIQPITASVAASALTITLNPTVLDFRASPITSGTVTSLVVSAAISVVIPSTSTMGTVSAVQSRLVVIAINNAGTVELAAVNIAGGSVLDETTLINTTAAVAAGNSATAYYSTTARTGVAYRVVGYIESTQATAGTWATAPSTIQGMGGQAVAAMSSLGYGQTWQAPSRSLATTYYNTTGKPITVIIEVQPASNDNRAVFAVNGVNIGKTTGNWGTWNSSNSWIVPVGGAYSLTNANGTVSIMTWSELR